LFHHWGARAANSFDWAERELYFLSGNGGDFNVITLLLLLLMISAHFESQTGLGCLVIHIDCTD
jgi:hypothetical protein